MCDSRLLIGVESWPCCTGSATHKLHVQRMKWLRSIDSSEVRSRDKEGDCSDDTEQSTEHKEPERDVLCRLEQNHTTVEVRARKLAYCLRLLKHASKGLLALLQSPSKKRLVHRSWSQILLDDTHSLIGASGSRLAELGDSQLTPHAWASCMRKHTGMIKKVTDGFLRSHAKASPVTSPTSIPTKTFSCGTCGKKCLTLQQLPLMSGLYTGVDRLEPTASTKAADVQCANAHSTQGYAQPSMWHRSQRAEKALPRVITR